MLSTFPVRCFEVFFFAYKKYIGDLRLCQVLLEVKNMLRVNVSLLEGIASYFVKRVSHLKLK